MGPKGARAVASLVGIVLMVGVLVVVATTMALVVFDIGSGLESEAPKIETDYGLVTDGSERSIAITLSAGDAVATDQLYVVGSKNLDIGGAPGSGTPANDRWASSRETFTESAGNNSPQVGIGPTWDAGETVYVDPVRDVEGVRVSIYWTTGPVEGINPGRPGGEHSYKIETFTVGS